MYFQDEKLHDLLMTHAGSFSHVEGDIATKLINYKKKQGALDPENLEQWQSVRSRLRHAFHQTRNSLNQLADKMATKN
jgi:hypothetical protein